MDNQIIEVPSAEVIEAQSKAEIDVQIATARKYPREINKVLNKIETYATMDTETAEDCFYALPARQGSTKTIEGLSVRLAEIIASAWGNLRVAARITANDGKTITAQGVCHDLESNVAVSVEVKRRITDKSGRTYSEDMQVVTGNAASAIAFRNAVLKVVPKAVTKKVINKIMAVAKGKSIDLDTRRKNMLSWYAANHITEQQILDYAGVKKVEELDIDKVFELRGLGNAIKEGSTTFDEAFKARKSEAQMAEEIKEKSKTASKIAEAMRGAKKTEKKAAAAPPLMPAPPKDDDSVFNEETGEEIR